MTSQHRVQQYMEKHKVARLFEDLMNRVIHDQPDEPLLYLIKVLCKKAGKEVPPEAKLSHLRRSTSDLPRAPASPEMARKNRPVSSTWTSGNQDGVVRPYERPWLANTKKVKPKRGDTEDQARPGRRHKVDWNPDTKVMPTNFDELFDESKGGKSRHGKNGVDNSRRAWASYGIGDGEENLFTSSGYRGPKRAQQEEDSLASELISPHRRADSRDAIQKSSTSIVSSGRMRGPRLTAEKHRHDLEKILHDSDQRSNDSGIQDDREDDSPDDAIELLEDADLLRKEGVKKVSSKGYRLSKFAVRQADPEVKLNINLYTGSGPIPSQQAKSSRYADLSEYEDSEREGSLIGSRYSPMSDEEFESVSQVTGPRHVPVWAAADSDGEAPVPRPPVSPHRSAPLALPYRSEEFGKSSPWENRLSATTPVRSADYTAQSMESNELFSRRYRPELQESVEMYGGPGGGWAVRDGSDVSQTDWKGTRKGRTQKTVDYRSY